MNFNPTSIFNISSNAEFEQLALSVFKIQRTENSTYKKYCDLILKGKQPKSLTEIPFLPIEFFKSKSIKTGQFEPEVIYSSSGTTGALTSKHYVRTKMWYLEVCRRAFEQSYGSLKEFRVLALLPSYLERNGSSLIDMVSYFIEQSDQKEGGFFLNNHTQLAAALKKRFQGKTLLIGVTFGLLDFAENQQIKLSDTIVMETGGMKGKRKELIRSEVHKTLLTSFSVPTIHSEYGMTELLSQAYSSGRGIFQSPPWMKVLIRQTSDPFTYNSIGKSGGVNIVDLANIDSCAFIQTQDLGKVYNDGSFEILGRFDESDVRGCNLLVQ